MEEFTYENIDLFYYHSIDIEFYRLYSIITNGILSARLAKEKNIAFYYRNYPKSSSKSDYISVSHFPQTLFRYYKIENELYNNCKNKITFVLSGDIDALDKQSNKNRFKYTNERHVYEEIKKESIIGILISQYLIEKPLNEINFNINYTDITFLNKKIFSIINFFKVKYGYFYGVRKIYELIGQIEEKKSLCEKINLDELKNYMTYAIYKTFCYLLNKDNPTLIDAILFITNNVVDIYVMNNFDIKKYGEKLIDRNEALKNIIPINKKEMIKYNKKIKMENRELKQVSDYGINIYFGYCLGPLTVEDEKIIKKLSKN